MNNDKSKLTRNEKISNHYIFLWPVKCHYGTLQIKRRAFNPFSECTSHGIRKFLEKWMCMEIVL